MAEELEQTVEDNKFAGLSNAEIVFIYYRLQKYMSNLNINLDKNVMTKIVETPMGMATAMVAVSDENVKKFKESFYYKTAIDTLEKLTPLVKVIEECDDSIKNVLEELK